MACFHPIGAFQARKPNRAGKRPVVFSPPAVSGFDKISLPCGQCVGCRLERSRTWAMRCMHEASRYENNCFLTLTYCNEHLPSDLSLDKGHWQAFMKSMRHKYVVYEDGEPVNPIRYYHCGEYGRNCVLHGIRDCADCNGIGRPHYHAVLFNHDFLDKELHKENFNGDHLYVSKALNEIWGKGLCVVGDVTFESAAYVARYIMKKMTGDIAEDHYRLVDKSTGEVFNLLPEYTTMSRNPGIGKDWFDEYSSDVFPGDRVIVRGKACRPPRYYDGLFEVENPEEFGMLKERRRKASRTDRVFNENHPKRLAAREEVCERRVDMLQRSVE